jgi:hypothetical protein
MTSFTGNIRRLASKVERPCVGCARPTTHPRKGLCFACYQRARRGHVTQSECAVCGTRDRRVLRRHKLASGLETLCANDAAIAGRRVLTLAALRAERFPDGDRRGTDQRTGDRRTYAERRARLELAWIADGDRREVRGRRATERAA